MDIAGFIRDNKKSVTIAAVGLAIFAAALGAFKIGGYISSRAAVKELKEVLASDEWVRVDKVGMAGFSMESALILNFDEEQVTYYSATDAGSMIGLGSLPIERVKIASFNYHFKDGRTMVLTDIGTVSDDIRVELKDDNNTLVISPSFTDGESSKEWYRKSDFVEDNPWYVKYFK